jgi:hypothetical protein
MKSTGYPTLDGATKNIRDFRCGELRRLRKKKREQRATELCTELNELGRELTRLTADGPIVL